jgi:hypothetical protein
MLFSWINFNRRSFFSELIDRFGEFLAPLLRHPSLQANREWKIPVETPIRCGLRFDSKFGMEPKNGSDTARMPSRHSKSSVLLRIRTDKLATRWYKKMAKFIQSTTRPFVGINLGQHTLSSQDHKKFLRLLSLNLPNLVYLHLKLSMSDFEDLLPRWAQIIPQLDYLNLLSITVESKIDDDKLAMLLEAISHCRSIYALQLCFDVQGRQIEQILEGLRYSCVAKITLPNLLRYCEFNRLSSYASRIFGWLIRNVFAMHHCLIFSFRKTCQPKECPICNQLIINIEGRVIIVLKVNLLMSKYDFSLIQYHNRFFTAYISEFVR